MSNMTNAQKATYALLADNVYWDVRNGFEDKKGTNEKDFTNSNWTPVPEGWTARRLGGASDTQHLFKLNIKLSFHSNIKLYLFLPRDEAQT